MKVEYVTCRMCKKNSYVKAGVQVCPRCDEWGTLNNTEEED